MTEKLAPPITETIVFAAVTDLARTHAFYSERLGFELVVDQSSCRIYRVTSTSFVGFCERPDEVNPGSIILTLITEDVDAWFDRAVKAGADVVKAPASNPRYKIRNGFVRDPDGLLIEIQRFDDPKWARPRR